MRGRRPEPRYLAVGRILRPHGVRGELRVEVLTHYPERLETLETVYVGETHRPHQLEGARLHQDVALLKIQGCDGRNAAEALRNELVYIAVEDAIPLEQDECYEFQLVGMDVTTDEGQPLGRIVEVFTAPGANDVLIVHGPLGEVLIPVTEEVVVTLNSESGQLVVHLLPGLLNDG